MLGSLGGVVSKQRYTHDMYVGTTGTTMVDYRVELPKQGLIAVQFHAARHLSVTGTTCRRGTVGGMFGLLGFGHITSPKHYSVVRKRIVQCALQ